MAGDWIKMRCNLWDDPRVARLCDETNQSEAAIIGGLYWLWATADQHTETGILAGLSLRQIDRKTGLQGFGAALCEIGWIEDTQEGVSVINFEEHNGASAKKRAQTARRVAKHSSKNQEHSEELTQEQQTTNAGSVSDALAREEKRREEISPESPSQDTHSSVNAQECQSVSISSVTPAQAGAMARALRPHNIPVTPSHPELLTWIAEGASVDLVLEAVELARMQKPAPQKIAPAYLTAIVRSLLGGPKSNGARAGPRTPTKHDARMEVARQLRELSDGADSKTERVITGTAERVG